LALSTTAAPRQTAAMALARRRLLLPLLAVAGASSGARGVEAQRRAVVMSPTGHSLTELFGDMDVDGDGFLDADEFHDGILNAVGGRGAGAELLNGSPDWCFELFELADVDRDGKLTTREIEVFENEIQSHYSGATEAFLETMVGIYDFDEAPQLDVEVTAEFISMVNDRLRTHPTRIDELLIVAESLQISPAGTESNYHLDPRIVSWLTAVFDYVDLSEDGILDRGEADLLMFVVAKAVASRLGIQEGEVFEQYEHYDDDGDSERYEYEYENENEYEYSAASEAPLDVQSFKEGAREGVGAGDSGEDVVEPDRHHPARASIDYDGSIHEINDATLGLIGEMDEDEDGRLSRSEFLSGALNVDPDGGALAHARKLFDEFDRNGDEHLDLREISQLVAAQEGL